jgi:SAM-dependent methyltransferase
MGPALSTPHERPVRDEVILSDLVRLAHEDPGRKLEQFASLAGAHQYRRLYRLFRRHVPPGATVLDWGSGNGHFSYFLTRAGYRATGFSLEGYWFRDWLGDPGYSLASGTPDDPVTLPFPAASFDAVASVGVLEHVRETGGSEGASLREIARVLRPAGVFVCYHLPNRHSLIESLARRLPGKYHHLWRYTRRDVEALVRGADLELLEVRRYGLLPRNSAHRLLGPLRAARAAARLWDAADAALGFLLSPLCENYCFVARKPRR